jgi:hypothetical protein
MVNRKYHVAEIILLHDLIVHHQVESKMLHLYFRLWAQTSLWRQSVKCFGDLPGKGLFLLFALYAPLDHQT